MSDKLVLYTKTGCPYCERVLDAICAYNISPVHIKNISDFKFALELRALGGKHQVPYLVDEEVGIGMYESENIINYLRNRTFKKVTS